MTIDSKPQRAPAGAPEAGGVAFANDGREPDWDRYATLEREHLGDADKATGIYHADNKAAAANAAGLSSPFAAAISYWTGPRMANGDPLDSPDNTSPNGWGEYEPTTLAHGKAIAERGDTDKRVKWLYDHRTPAEKAGGLSALPFAILTDEMAALRRFDECASDGEGYDVPKDMMKRLAEIGLVRRVTANLYEHTTFGLAVLIGEFDGDRAPAADRAALKDGEA